MRTKDEIEEQLDVAKKLYFDDNHQGNDSFVHGWVHALQWVLGEDNAV